MFFSCDTVLLFPLYAFPLNALVLGGPLKAQLFHSHNPKAHMKIMYQRKELNTISSSVEVVAKVQAGTAGRDLTFLTKLRVLLHSRFMREENLDDSGRLNRSGQKPTGVLLLDKE